MRVNEEKEDGDDDYNDNDDNGDDDDDDDDDDDVNICRNMFPKNLENTSDEQDRRLHEKNESGNVHVIAELLLENSTRSIGKQMKSSPWHSSQKY
ncbi:hypothetical protein PoB_000016300 [Plakobranchus ocellatus]|uniref:Uncharacterized protein n=1 Tax=Plakobranchus ocellatus TaxID=259542 RepID=A0AAV3XUE7_9GAST|nr:hypothetical protein PoB_000016300 [Plakobranchus ocellatus]